MNIETYENIVLERLTRREGVVRIPSDNLHMFFMRNFIPDSLCDSLIKAIDSQHMPSVVYPPSNDNTFRTSSTSHLDRTDASVIDLEIRLSDISGLMPELGEPVQGQRYTEGQQFKLHMDAFPIDTINGSNPYLKSQRTWTFMAYLNSTINGGETKFPYIGFNSKPRKGNLLAWLNVNHDGTTNPYSAHTGLPVVTGSKYIITKWYRTQAYLPDPDSNILTP
jgi:prolyl 4-hydroxylase